MKLEDKDFNVTDTGDSIKLWVGTTMVLKWERYNEGELILTNGTHKTTSANLYSKLEEYCKEQDYKIIQNEIVGEYRGHIRNLE